MLNSYDIYIDALFLKRKSYNFFNDNALKLFLIFI